MVAEKSELVQAAIRERTTVHDYATTEVQPDALTRALRAALSAPNHRMTEPWRFVVVGRQSRQALVEISVALKAAKVKGELDPSTVRSTREKMLNPAQLVVASQVRVPNPEVAREDYAAMACAIQNIMLSLHSEGIGSKWSTGAVIRDARTYQHLGIDSNLEEIVGFIWVGMPADPPAKLARKRALDQVVRYLP